MEYYDFVDRECMAYIGVHYFDNFDNFDYMDYMDYMDYKDYMYYKDYKLAVALIQQFAGSY
jgi:hypothetical protein